METCTEINNGVTPIPTAGTPVQLSSSSVPCMKVIIKAPQSNQGDVAFGAAGLSASSPTAATLSPGESVPLEINDLNKVWLDATVSGDKIAYTYLKTVFVP